MSEMNPALVNLEAERTVLGAVMVDSEAWTPISEILDASDYFDSRHRILHECFDGMATSGELKATGFDIVTVKHYLATSNQSVSTAYIASLFDGLPRISNVVAWCKIVKEKARRRKAVAIAQRLIEKAGDDTSSIDVSVDAATSAIMALSDVDGGGVDVSIVDALKGAVRLIETHIERKGMTGIPTGLLWLDQKTGGMQAGDLFLYAARPSCGKSVMSSQTVIAASRAGFKIRVFPLEMSPDRTARRILLSEAGVDRYSILKDENAWAKITHSFGKLKCLDVVFDSRSSPTVAQIRASAMRQKKTTGLDLLVVDHLQRVAFDRGRVEERVGVGQVAQALKTVARDLEIPVLCTCQLNRIAEKMEPTLAELAESGSIEREADVVLAFHPDLETKASNFPVTKGILLKNRDGAVGRTDLYFEKQLTRFVEASQFPGSSS